MGTRSYGNDYISQRPLCNLVQEAMSDAERVDLV